MLNNLNQPLTKHYPGPFIVAAGNDWFDATFDIICLETEERIVSTYYWDSDEEPEASTVAETVAAALNEAAGHPMYLPQPFPKQWPEFQAQTPGPYATKRNRCPGRGKFVEVVCKTTGRSVIQCYDIARSATPKQLARHIAASLNVLLEDPRARAKAKQMLPMQEDTR